VEIRNCSAPLAQRAYQFTGGAGGRWCVRQMTYRFTDRLQMHGEPTNEGSWYGDLRRAVREQRHEED